MSPTTVVATIDHGTSGAKVDFTRLNAAADYALNTAGKGFHARFEDSNWTAIAMW